MKMAIWTSQIHQFSFKICTNRKSNTYVEHKIFPYVSLDDLRLDLMNKVRNLVKSRKPDHDWLQMSDQDILKSAGLWEKDFSSGVQGIRILQEYCCSVKMK